MKHTVVLTVFLCMPTLSYGMEATARREEVDLRALEEGTRGEDVRDPNFRKEVARLKEMGLIDPRERDVEEQIAGLTPAQRNRLMTGKSTRCGSSSGGGGFWGWFSGGNQTDGESLYLLRDLHRMALEEQRRSEARVEEVEKLSRRFKIVLVLVGTGLLGSLGANGGLLADLFSGSAEAASNV